MSEPVTTERLADASNLWDRALFILHERGYRLFVENRSGEEESWETWIAEKPGLRFEGESPLSLLGTVVVRERLGAEWRDVDLGNITALVVEREPSG